MAAMWLTGGNDARDCMVIGILRHDGECRDAQKEEMKLGSGVTSRRSLVVDRDDQWQGRSGDEASGYGGDGDSGGGGSQAKVQCALGRT